MAEAQSEAKMLEALKLLETDEKEIGLRKASILAYLNTRKQNQVLEKQKAALQEELTGLQKTIEDAKAAHVKDWNSRQDQFKLKADEWQEAHEKQREADQKELAGLKASIAKAKKQTTDAEKDAEKRIADANQKADEAIKAAVKITDDLDKQAQERRDQIARLDEEFRSIAARHGLGAAIGG